MSLIRPGLSALKKLKGAKAESAMKRPFYSAVDKAIEDIVGKQPKGTGDQYLAMILKTKGVKPAEVKDRGIDKALQGKGKMSGQDLLSVAEKRPPVAIRETRLEEYLDDYAEPKGDVHYGVEDYGQYRTPGGENYREILIKLPQERVQAKPISVQDLIDQGYRVEDLSFNPVTFQSSYRIVGPDGNWVSQRSGAYGISHPGQALIDYAQNLSKREAEEANKPKFRAPHFGDEGKNLLAHARVQDMIGPNGEKIMLIDEIQSDWHQAGRSKGYRTPEVDEAYRRLDQEYQEYINGLKPRIRALLESKNIPEESIGSFLKIDEYNLALLGEADKFSEFQNKLFKMNPERFPADAPFKKNWHELVMKRLMDDAVKNGYDRVIITPGAVQARRYDLSQHVDKLIYNPETEYLSAIKGVEVPFMDRVPKSELQDYVGKEVAEKLLSQTPVNGESVLSGLDMDIGGQGMKGFYDQILPSYIKKQYGVELGQFPVRTQEYDVVRSNQGDWAIVPQGGMSTVKKGFATPEEARAAAEEMGNVPYHSFDITPEMRESIINKGQPLYQMAPVGVGAASISDEEPETYKEGGDVKNNNKEVKEDSELSSFRFYGGGGKDQYAFDAGGRLLYDIPVGKNSVISPYVQGYVVKPSGAGLSGKLTGAGIQFRKSFKKGGSVESAPSLDAMRLAVIKRK